MNKRIASLLCVWILLFAVAIPASRAKEARSAHANGDCAGPRYQLGA